MLVVVVFDESFDEIDLFLLGAEQIDADLIAPIAVFMAVDDLSLDLDGFVFVVGEKQNHMFVVDFKGGLQEQTFLADVEHRPEVLIDEIVVLIDTDVKDFVIDVDSGVFSSFLHFEFCAC